MIARLFSSVFGLRSIRRNPLHFQSPMASFEASTSYWSEHNVSSHRVFTSAEDSLGYFHWRCDQYPGYLKLMPVSCFDDQAVLDYGCGPGHDLVGFSHYSRCRLLVGADVSPTSLAEARQRLSFHQSEAPLVLLDGSGRLPFPDNTFDHIHSSGVLHHVPDIASTLLELKRVLRPGGTLNIMVYNYNSIWLHLYVAYQRSILQGLYPGLPLADQFRASTDGEECPISRCFTPAQWCDLSSAAGFDCLFAGAAISLFELSLLPQRFSALMDERLPVEHREFLGSLTFDIHGHPLFQGAVAGIDACYRLTKP